MPPMYGGGDGALLLLGVNHARSLHEAGLTKRDLQEALWALARLPRITSPLISPPWSMAPVVVLTVCCGAPKGRSASMSSSLAVLGRRMST